MKNSNILVNNMDYTQCYCKDCLYCGYDVFGGGVCFAKGIVIAPYTRACKDIKDRYDNEKENDLAG